MLFIFKYFECPEMQIYSESKIVGLMIIKMCEL